MGTDALDVSSFSASDLFSSNKVMPTYSWSGPVIVEDHYPEVGGKVFQILEDQPGKDLVLQDYTTGETFKMAKNMTRRLTSADVRTKTKKTMLDQLRELVKKAWLVS